MTGGNVGMPSLLRDQVQQHVFLSQSRSLNAFDAFFTAESPFFMHHIPLADNYGRLLLPFPNGQEDGWAGICITAAGDGQLAWELTRHMIYAYTNPVGRAAIEPVWGGPASRGNHCLSTPIVRSLFRDHAQRAFEDTFTNFSRGLQTFVGFDCDENRALQFEAAINRIASYNEQPMGMFSPMIPAFLIEDHFDQFRRGLITAETAAQRMHNAVSLWLIE